MLCSTAPSPEKEGVAGSDPAADVCLSSHFQISLSVPPGEPPPPPPSPSLSLYLSQITFLSCIVVGYIVKKGLLIQAIHNITENTHSLCSIHTLSLSLQKTSLPDLLALCPAGLSQDKFISQLTLHWYSWPFYHQPFWMQARVADMYITEGPKVLYRLGLSALKLFVAQGRHLSKFVYILHLHHALFIAHRRFSYREQYPGVHCCHDAPPEGGVV